MLLPPLSHRIHEPNDRSFDRSNDNAATIAQSILPDVQKRSAQSSDDLPKVNKKNIKKV
jgi:hypothetical protein